MSDNENKDERPELINKCVTVRDMFGNIQWNDKDKWTPKTKWILEEPTDFDRYDREREKD